MNTQASLTPPGITSDISLPPMTNTNTQIMQEDIQNTWFPDIHRVAFIFVVSVVQFCIHNTWMK
jgi:hypothetical protein